MNSEDVAPLAEQTASATKAASTELGRRDRWARFRGARSAWLSAASVWLLIALAAAGMFASTPPSAGADEPTHQATAWYDTEVGLPPSVGYAPNTPISLRASVPASLVINPCFARKPQVNASCLPPQPADASFAVTPSITNYPPPYYWVVGAGQRLAAVVGLEYAGIGGRLASLVVNLGVLLLLALYLARRHRDWPVFLLLVATPTAVFNWVVVNPSGWEISSALVMAVLLAEVAWVREGEEPAVPGRGTVVLLALASISLCLARPIGFVWAAGLTVTVIALAPATQRRASALRVTRAVAPGIALGVLWVLTHPSAVGLPKPGYVASPLTPGHLLGWFAASLETFPTQLRQMFGVLGANDTLVPVPMFLVSVVVWAVLLIRIRPGVVAAACGVIGIVIAPSALAATGWGAWPNWWQGRYTLPLAMALLLLLLLRSGQRSPRLVSMVAGVALLSMGLMVWLNALRYAFGLSARSLPLLHTPAAIGPIPLGFSLFAGAVIVVASVVPFLRAVDRGWPTLRRGQPEASGGTGG